MESALNFLSQALTNGITTRFAKLVALPEFSADGPFAQIDKIRDFCDAHNLECSPTFLEGELNDDRFFSLRISATQYETLCNQALEKGECHTVEFKETLFLDVKRLKNDSEASNSDLISKAVEHEVVKTITGFANADGGLLIVGVTDSAEVTGIDLEFPYLPGSKKDGDGWCLRLNSLIESSMVGSKEMSSFTQYDLITVGEVLVCVIKVRTRQDRLVCCRAPDGKEEICYQRAGNSTNKLTPHAIEALIRARLIGLR